MSVWDTYQGRMSVHGMTKREAVFNREVRAIHHKLPDSLSYHEVTIHDTAHGYNIESEEMSEFAVTQNVAVINSDNLNEKTIISMPGEDIEHGALVHWMGNYWLVTDRDANTTLYTRAKMVQCNHLLRWISDNDILCEQWCIVEDGTKYLTGEFEDRQYIVTRGDSRISLTLARNTETVKLDRNNRFIIDDEDAPRPLAYSLTKPLKKGPSYNGRGVFKFVLQEVTTTDDDNLDLLIADYYKHFPATTTVDNHSGSIIDTDHTDGNTGRSVWL